MADSPEEIRKTLKTYTMVGATLLVFTCITVAVAYLTPSITVGLLIATFKAGLVAAVFMHLNSEKPTIYKILFFTFIFVSGLMLLFMLALHDPITIK